MINHHPLAALPVKSTLDDVCLLEGDGPTPGMYAFLQGGDYTGLDPDDVVASQPDPTTPWQDQVEADRSDLAARYRALRPLANNHLYLQVDPEDDLGETRDLCVDCCGDWRASQHGPVLTPAQSEELGILAQLLVALEEPDHLDDLDCEPTSPTGWVVLRDSLVAGYAREHGLDAQVVRDRAERTLQYRGVRFVAFLRAMLHDGIRQGRHTGHEVQYVKPDTIEYCQEVIRVVDGVLHLAEEVTEDASPTDPYLYCATCEAAITPDEIGAGELAGLG